MARNENIDTSHNLISKDTIVKGEIITKGNFRIDGTVEGDIKSEGKVIIGLEGKFIGTMLAKDIDIMGTVDGEIIASNTLSLKSTGNVTGKIQTSILEIEQHAEFNGTCVMGKNAKTASTSTTEVQESTNTTEPEKQTNKLKKFFK